MNVSAMWRGNGDLDEPIHHSSEGDIGAVFNTLEQARVRLARATEDMKMNGPTLIILSMWHRTISRHRLRMCFQSDRQWG
jgi:hypothetical protein